MPGRRTVPVDPDLCRRCQIDPPTINVRTEPLCAACFFKYVSTKIVKRMESFRVRHRDPGRERVLLLPLSLGPCSTCLLHILSQHLQGQAQKTGRTGFRLHVLYVSSPESEGDAAVFEKVRERYPEHLCSTIPLENVLACDGVSELLQRQNPSPISDSEESTSTVCPAQRLASLFSSLPSPTSRTDMKAILQRKLITTFAQQNNCEAILWGDSTTRLAERTLAETAKGRGASLPWIVADGDALHGIPFYYPLRDLLSKEISSFTSMVELPLDDMILREASKPAVSTKNTTIDELMRQYFESVEQEYPSIVANVVKTTGKLCITDLGEVERQCELCDVPLDGQAPEKSRLCYGCIRTLPAVT